MPRVEWIAPVLIAALLIALGVAIGYWIWGRALVEVHEGYAPAIEHADGSITAARVPGAKLDIAAPTKPPGKTTRVLEVRVQPKPVKCAEAGAVVQPPPVGIRADWTRLLDGTGRVSIRAENGEILDAVDVPMEPALAFRKNSLGFTHYATGVQEIHYGRDFGRVTANLSVQAPDGFGQTRGKDLAWGVGGEWHF